MDEELRNATEKIEDEFSLDRNFLVKAKNHFLTSMDAGLTNEDAARVYMPMLPSFVTSLPTGKELGLFLAADLGSNFRVCSIDLHGDHSFDSKQSKYPVPKRLMKNSTSDALFSFLASKLQEFLKTHHHEIQNSTALKMGFTFSFPVEQIAIDRGKLIRWTKGYSLPDCVGRDVVEFFQKHIDMLNLPISIVALTNDTVGTLLARSYTNNSETTNSRTVIGAIFGTGTNGAYFEKLSNIPKLAGVTLPGDAQGMVINMEWGLFDNSLDILPATKYDNFVDKVTPNRGYHLFEKRISGMFLGEILRAAIVDLHEKSLILKDMPKAKFLPATHLLNQRFLILTEQMARFEIDESENLEVIRTVCETEWHLTTTIGEREAIKILTRAISKRAAYLCAIPLSAIVTRVKDEYRQDDKDFEVGCVGSIIEFYPGFEEHLLDAFNKIGPLKGSNKKIILKLEADGSEVGAALCASNA